MNGNLILSTNGVQINLNEYANPTQLNNVIVDLSTPDFNNQTESVENIKSKGSPAVKPNKNIRSAFGCKSGIVYNLNFSNIDKFIR